MPTQNPAKDDEFVTVSEEVTEPETKIVFDTIGDQFTGIYLGMREQDGESGRYQQARFQDLESNEIYFTNAGYSLRNGLKNARPGQKVRVTFSSETDTGQANPMRNFTVEVARQKSVTNARRVTSANTASKPSS